MTVRTRWMIWLVVITLFFLFLFAVKSVLLPFVIGIFAAYFLDPAADKLETWGLKRTPATAIIVCVFFGILITGLVFLVPLFFKEAEQFAQAVPTYIHTFKTEVIPQLSSYADKLGIQGADKGALGSMSGKAFKMGGDFFDNLLQSGFAILNLASLLLITPVVAFYLLRDWDRITAKIDELLPRDYAPIIRAQVHKVDETLSAFLRGQVNVCVIMAFYNAIALAILGLDYAVVVGALSGFLIIIPYLGTAATGLIAVGMAYAQFDSIERVLAVAAVFIIGQVAEGNFITPKLVGEKVGLHPVWVIFGMLAGAALFGFVGVFIAVPATAVIGVLVRFAIEQYRKSDLYSNPTDRIVMEEE